MGGAKMKANELRIGNFVYFDKTITHLNCGDLLQIAFEKIINPKATIKPIPLTEQWLKDFEFEQRGKRNFYVNRPMGLIKMDKGWGICMIDSGNVLFHTFSCIDYVHQLQNLYFELTGKELIKS